MPMVFGAIAPHGFSVMLEMSDDAEGGLKTRASMEEMERRLKATAPDVVVIAGPHGFRVEGSICVADVGRGAGTLSWNGRQVEMNVPIDGEMTDAIIQAAEAKGVSVARGGYAGTRRSQSVMPIDWGVITPLWFAGHGRNMVGHGHVLAPKPQGPEGPPVVIATPSRSQPREHQIAFGQAIAEASETDGRRVAFIASCDWGHRHSEAGPYGYHEASARVDAQIVDAVKSEDLRRLLAISDEEANEAAIDGLWQTLILQGVLEHTPMPVDLLSYEAPTYYGMIVATYSGDAAAS